MTNRFEENGGIVVTPQMMEEAKQPIQTDPSVIVRQIREDQSRRCLEEVNAVLRKHSCELLPIITIRGGRIESGISVVPIN